MQREERDFRAEAAVFGTPEAASASAVQSPGGDQEVNTPVSLPVSLPLHCSGGGRERSSSQAWLSGE